MADGNLYVADSDNWRFRKVDGTGTIRSVAGNGHRSYGGDGGPAIRAPLWTPGGSLPTAEGRSPGRRRRRPYTLPSIGHGDSSRARGAGPLIPPDRLTGGAWSSKLVIW